MTIKEITTRNEYQTFDCKSIQIEPKALAVPVVTFGNAANGANVPSFRTDDFILKITVPKVAENVQKQTGNVTENVGKVAENHSKVAEKHGKVTEKLKEKAAALGETLTANRGKSSLLSDVNKHIYTIAREEFEVVFSNKIDYYE